MIPELLANRVFICAMIAWIIGQAVKVPLEYWRTQKVNWSLLFSTGGMPSSHTAMVTATALSIGLYYGFDSPLFALAVVVASVVSYDATGIRRQAGLQAEKINQIIEEVFSGHPLNEKQLKEMLGHSPMEVIGGLLLGIAIAVLIRLLWPLPV